MIMVSVSVLILVTCVYTKAIPNRIEREITTCDDLVMLHNSYRRLPGP